MRIFFCRISKNSVKFAIYFNGNPASDALCTLCPNRRSTLRFLATGGVSISLLAVRTLCFSLPLLTTECLQAKLSDCSSSS